MSDSLQEASPKRLLVVVNVFSPDRGGGGAIFSDLCYGLADRGYEVTARCAYPYYPEWRDKSEQNGLAILRYDEQGVHVERYGLFIPRNARSLIQRLLYEASFLCSVARSLHRGGGFDLVMVYCPLMGAVAFAVLNKWLHRKPLWLNVQDLSADAAAASGIARGRLLKGALSSVQQWLFNRADLWSSISPVMIERLKSLRLRGQPVLYLPNWLNASMAEAIAALPPKLGRLPKNEVKLLYAGNIGAKQDLLRLCASLEKSDAPFRFRIHGDGGLAGEVRQWVEARHDPRFAFGPFLDEPAFAEALHETDLFVITEKRGSGGSFIPCKTIAGIASGSPILAVCDEEGPLGQEVRSNDLGPWFSWDQLEHVAPMIGRLPTAPGPFGVWQCNALSRAQFYKRERVIDAFDHALCALLETAPPYSEDTFESAVE